MIRAIRKALVAFWKWWEREAMKGPPPSGMLRFSQQQPFACFCDRHAGYDLLSPTEVRTL